MFNKKYIILYLILLLLLARLYLLFAGLENLIPPYPEDSDLYIGTVAKMTLDGSINSILDYNGDHHKGVHSIEVVSTIPFFYMFGVYLIPLKLVTLPFLLLTMVLWFLFVRKHINHSTAVLTSLLFILAPPSFINFNLVMGAHSKALFFDILGLTVFFKTLNQKKRLIWYILFGIVSGFAMWSDPIFGITLITCMFLWFIDDKLFFLKGEFVWFIVSFLIGFIPWFYYNCVLYDFKTLTTLFKYHQALPKLGFFVRLKGFLGWYLPYSTCFKNNSFLNGNWPAYFYYLVFLCCTLGTCWWQRKYILNVVRSFITGKLQATQRVAIKVELFFLGYILVFIIVLCRSHLNMDYKSPVFFSYKYLTPLYPFIFVIVAIGLTTLLNSRRKHTKIISLLLIFIILLTGGIGLVNQTSITDFGKGLRFQGYSYKALTTYILKHNNSGDVPGAGSINKLNDIDDNELYKNSLCSQGMFGIVLINKLDPTTCASLIGNINQKFHHNCYEGLGYGYVASYGGSVSTLFEKLETINFTNKAYEKYFLYGIATSLPIHETIDKHTFMISQFAPQFQPYFYQGLGIRLAMRMGLADADGILLQVDETNKKYCYIGIGQNLAKSLEWAFADKKYPISFDGLNKEYWHDCYYGLGWGIGDFFEFDIERYLAVIKNNVSSEYMEYCFKGLADRLSWKFGGDAKKFQKVTELFPEPYKALNVGTHVKLPID